MSDPHRFCRAMHAYIAVMALTLAGATAWLVALTLAGAWLVGCSRPSPVPVSPGAPAWAELVEAGCVADDDAGPAALVAEQGEPDAPAWVGCLLDGGTVAGCAVPCDASSAGSRR